MKVVVIAVGIAGILFIMGYILAAAAIIRAGQYQVD